MKRIPLLSFFSGGGFLDIGFEQEGFEIAWTNEHDEPTADAYSHGMTAWRKSLRPSANTVDISSRESIRELSPSKILKQAFGGSAPEFFGIIGGPPCIDFSIGGQNAGSTGKHGRLSGEFVKKINQLRPDFFVIENVPRLLLDSSHSSYLKYLLRKLSKDFLVRHKVLNSLELGAPQNRERLFVIGVSKKTDLAQDAFNNFRWPTDPKYAGAKTLDWPRESPFNGIPEKPTGIPEELFSMHALGGLKGLEHLPNGKEFFVPYSKKFWKVPEGKVSAKSFKRLHRYRYSPTVWYGNNEVHLHPWEARRLSVRESMRLQTIPDSYVLPDEIFLSKKFKIVSNGVPCLLARKVAAELASVFKP